MGEDQLKSRAFRYAGYAVACYDQKLSISDISLTQHQDRSERQKVILELTNYLPQLDPTIETSRNVMEKTVISLFSSLESEKKFRKSNDLNFKRSEYKKLRQFVAPFTRSDRELTAYVNLLAVRAQDFLKDVLVWQQIKDLAHEIIKRKEISGREARHIIRDSFSRSFEKWKKKQQSKQRPVS
jgi:hypothetical protein